MCDINNSLNNISFEKDRTTSPNEKDGLKTNKNDYRLLKENLNTKVNNYIDFSNLELDPNFALFFEFFSVLFNLLLFIIFIVVVLLLFLYIVLLLIWCL